MAIVRSYDNNFSFVDRTPEIMLIPNSWDIINQLNIFPSVPEGVMSHSITVEKITEDGATIVDLVRGSRPNVSKDFTRQVYSFPIPYYAFDDHIGPQDIQGRTAYGTNDQAENVAAAVARKLKRIKRSWAWEREVARAKVLTAGTVYAPNGTVSIDYYSAFGITRLETDCLLGTAGTDIAAKVETAIASITDNLQSGDNPIEGFVGLASPVFFAKLIAHSKVTNAYQYYSSNYELLRDRLPSALNLPKGTRTFFYQGVLFIEYRGTYNGTALIPSGDCYVVPQGRTDAFASYAGPALKMDLVNTMGVELYVFEYTSPKGDGIDFESESSTIDCLRKPQAVVRLYSSN